MVKAFDSEAALALRTALPTPFGTLGEKQAKGSKMNRRPIAELSGRGSATRQRSPDLGAMAEVIATLAHELNNPLSVIAGHAQMLQEMVGDERIAARAGKIAKAALRSARIVKSTLALAR